MSSTSSAAGVSSSACANPTGASSSACANPTGASSSACANPTGASSSVKIVNISAGGASSSVSVADDVPRFRESRVQRKICAVVTEYQAQCGAIVPVSEPIIVERGKDKGKRKVGDVAVDTNPQKKIRQVSIKGRETLLPELEELIEVAVDHVLRGEDVQFLIPKRDRPFFDEGRGRMVLEESGSSTRSFASRTSRRKMVITVRVVRVAYELILQKIHVTKRDLFYHNVTLFKTQGESDQVLDDIACMMNTTRSSLHIHGATKGLVVGCLTFSDNGDHIDCLHQGSGAKGIPPIEKVSNMAVVNDAKFILLVEKDAVFYRLAEDKFYNEVNCIIITGKGQPDVCTRQFLQKMRKDLRLPVFALVDADPYGVHILSVYAFGSKAMSYDSLNLATPDIRWLGIRMSDIEGHRLPTECLVPMTVNDIKRAKELLEEGFIQRNQQWVDELKLMISMGKKIEIQALSVFGFQYITNVYLKLKILNRDWI